MSIIRSADSIAPVAWPSCSMMICSRTGARHVLARLGVLHAHIRALAHHLRHFRQAHIGLEEFLL